MNYMRLDGTFGPRSITHLDWIPMRESIKELLTKCMSAGEVASALSRQFECRVTRNMVIGQLRRHPDIGKLYQRNKWGDIIIPGAPRIKKEPAKRIRNRKAAPKVEKPDAPETSLADDLSIPLSQRLALLQLNASTCHWPIGDPTTTEFFFCGAESYQGKPYCAAHCRRAFNYEAKTTRFKGTFSREDKPFASPDSVTVPLRRVG